MKKMTDINELHSMFSAPYMSAENIHITLPVIGEMIIDPISRFYFPAIKKLNLVRCSAPMQWYGYSVKPDSFIGFVHLSNGRRIPVLWTGYSHNGAIRLYTPLNEGVLPEWINWEDFSADGDGCVNIVPAYNEWGDDPFFD